MSHAVWFDAELECLHCGHISRDTRLHTSSLLVEPGDQWARPGDHLTIDQDDLHDAYHPSRELPERGEFETLERWRCVKCGMTQWARIRFMRLGPETLVYLGATTTPLDAAALDAVSYVSRWMAFWLETNPEMAGELEARLSRTVGADAARTVPPDRPG